MLLKWRRNTGEWVVMYGDALKNRLRRDKNLADLTNRTEAKKNLGVFGEVTDHYHDARYMTRIEALEGNLIREAQAREQAQKLSDQALRKKIEAEVNAVLQAYNVSIADERKVRQNADNDIIQQINNEVKNRTQLLADVKKIQDKDRSDAQKLVNEEIQMRTAAITESERKEGIEHENIKKLINKEAENRKAAIETEVKNRNTAIDNKATTIQGWISTEATNRDNAIAKAQTTVTELVNAEASARRTDVGNLQKADGDIKKAYGEADAAIRKDIVDRFSHFAVSKAAPAHPVNNKTIWFNISDNVERILIYKNNQWVDFGSRYLPG